MKKNYAKTIYSLLKKDGVYGALRAICRLVIPKRLEYYPQCKPYLQSRIGLEVGGPSDIFKKRGHVPVYSIAARIDNCNFAGNTTWEGAISEGFAFIFDNRKPPGRQYIAEASNLQCIEDASYDFVLSSHCIEHLANPLRGLEEWIRVLKKDGLLVLVVPHKDGTFDHRRPVTSLKHLIQDFDSQTDEGDATHLEEILRLHDLSRDPGAVDFQFLKDRSKFNI